MKQSPVNSDTNFTTEVNLEALEAELIEQIDKPKIIQPAAHKIICSQFNLMLNSGFRTGISPIYWDKSNDCAKITSSKGQLLRYWLTMIVIILSGCKLFVKLLENGFNEGFHVKNMYLMYHSTIFSSFVLSVLLHIHTAFRKKELAALINGLMSFWKTFTERCSEHDPTFSRFEKDANFIAIMAKFSHHGLLMSCVAAIPGFLMKCDFHLLHPILPVCYNHGPNPYKWCYKDPILFLSMCFLQILSCWFQGSSILVLVSVVSFAVILCRAAWRELTDHGGNYAKSKSHIDLIKSYRCLQILSQYMNNCFSKDIWPCLIFIMAALCSLLLSIAVRFDNVPVQIGSGMAFIILLTMLCTFVDYSSKHYTKSQDFIQSKTIYAKRKYVKKNYYSCLHCTSFRVKVGPFFCLGRFTVAIILSAVFENTCAILILANK